MVVKWRFLEAGVGSVGIEYWNRDAATAGP